MSVGIINAVLVLMALAFVWMIVRFNQNKKNKYEIVDLLMGPNNRASLTNHILLAMAGMSIWVIVDRSNDGKDVETLLLGVLAIFVVGKTTTAVTDILNRSAEAPPPKPKPKGG